MLTWPSCLAGTSGQLGQSQFVDALKAMVLVSGNHNWTQISAGYLHT